MFVLMNDSLSGIFQETVYSALTVTMGVMTGLLPLALIVTGFR